jgi:hypothetical protein
LKELGQPLFPIGSIETYLRSFLPSLERNNLTLRWPSGDGVSELSVAPTQIQTFDNLLISEVVTLTHASPLLEELPLASIARLNAWATISSLIPGDSHGPTRFISKVGIFSGDQAAAESLYAPLLASEAAVVGWHAARMARNELRGNPIHSPLNLTDQEPPFDRADFEALGAVVDRSGYFNSVTGSYFTVEFPWESGAITNLYRQEEAQRRLRETYGVADEQLDRASGKTSLLQIRTGDHPLYGKGILSTLELPFSPEDPSGQHLADELNAWELTGADLPPHFGAWCVGDRAIAYISFMPTQFCIPGLLHNLIVWMAARQARARNWLGASPSRH